MNNNNSVISKKAFSLGGDPKSDCIYDHSITNKEVTVLWTESKDRLSIFDNRNGNRIYNIQSSWDDNIEFDVYDTAIIIKYNDSHLQGAIVLQNSKYEIPVKYLKVDYVSGYLITTTLDNKKGLYASDNLHILDDIYDEINIKEHYIEVVLDGKIGLFSFNGTKLIKPVYDYIDYGFHYMQCGFYNSEKSYLYSYTGKKITDVKKGDYYYHTSYGIEFHRGKKIGFFALNGNRILPLEYDSIEIDDTSWLDHPLIIMKKDDKYGLCTMEGKIILQPEFEIVRIGARIKGNHFSSEYITVRSEGHYGIYSYDSSLILPVIFDDILEFNEVASKVVLNNVTGYYFLKEQQFKEGENFNLTKTGAYELKVNGNWTVITL